MRELALPLSLLLMLGCSVAEGPNRQAELENVARCFHESVTLLQRHPSPANLGEFLREAFSQLHQEDLLVNGADFGALRWNAAGDTVITSSGAPILCRMAEPSHDHYGPEGTAFLFAYEFYVEGADERAGTTITLRTP